MLNNGFDRVPDPIRGEAHHIRHHRGGEAEAGVPNERDLTVDHEVDREVAQQARDGNEVNQGADHIQDRPSGGVQFEEVLPRRRALLDSKQNHWIPGLKNRMLVINFLRKWVGVAKVLERMNKVYLILSDKLRFEINKTNSRVSVLKRMIPLKIIEKLKAIRTEDHEDRY